MNNLTYHSLFERLNAADIQYVILRKHDLIGEGNLDDVDVLVHPDEYSRAMTVFDDLGFFTKSTDGSSQFLSLFSRATSRPLRTLRLTVTSPIHIVEEVIHSFNEDENQLHKNVKYERYDLHIDLRNNLAYKSPMNDKRYPVDPSCTSGMISRRKIKNDLYIPHPSDELAHIVAHCIFDKKGNFSSYYTDRCNQLLDVVGNAPESDRLLKELLSKKFYKAGDMVYDMLLDGDYEVMLSNLKTFTDY